MPTKILTTKFDVKIFTKTDRASTPTFFELAKKNIIKKRSGMGKNLSKDIDKIAYDRV
jgi:hypothetical protein